MAFRAFIFDMDGTLVDNTGAHLEIWLELLKEHGVEISGEQFFRRVGGKTNPEILRELIGTHLTDAEIAEYARHKEALYRERYKPHLKAVDGAPEFLRAARRLRIPAALATAAGQTNIDFILQGLGIEDVFDVVVNGDMVKQGKPHPEMFLTAAQKLGIPAEQCLVFEDSLGGIQAAQRAGMGVVAITTTLPEREFQGQDGIVRVIGDFADLDPASLLA